MKKTIALLVLAVMLIMALPMTAFAGGHSKSGHHGGSRHSGTGTSGTAWHSATDYYAGHNNNQCAQYDHVWHSAVRGSYSGHYAYACNDYGHTFNHTACNSGYHH